MKRGTYFESPVPNFCAGCGRKFDWSDYYQRQDLFAKCSHSCSDCGATYIMVDRSDLSEEIQAELKAYE